VLDRLVSDKLNSAENALALSDQDRKARRLSRPPTILAGQHSYVARSIRLTDIALGAMVGTELW